MTIKVLLRSAVLLIFLVTFATSAVAQNDDLVFESDFEIPVIERQRQNSIFQRIRRGLFDFWGNSNTTEPATTEEPETPAEVDEEQQGQVEDEYLPFGWNDTTGQQTADYNEPANFVNSNLSQDRQTRDSGEEPSGTEHPNDIDGGTSDDEDDYEGSSEIEGSAEGMIDVDESPFHTIPFHEPVPIPRPDQKPVLESPSCDPSSSTTEATDDRLQNLLEAMESRLAGIDKLNESVQRLIAAINNLNINNESLKKESAELRKMNVELSKRLEHQDQRITYLEATSLKQSAPQSGLAEQRFMELECQAFAKDLITARGKFCS